MGVNSKSLTLLRTTLTTALAGLWLAGCTGGVSTNGSSNSSLQAASSVTVISSAVATSSQLPSLSSARSSSSVTALSSSSVVVLSSSPNVVASSSSVKSSSSSVKTSSSTIQASSSSINASSSVQASASSAAAIVCDFPKAKAVFERNNCLLCHNATIFAGNGGGLNLDTGNVGQRLLDAPTQHGGTACANEVLIDALDPDNSLLLKLINKNNHTALNATSCKRQPMPQTANFMSASDYACVKAWVEDVAKNELPLPPAPTPVGNFAPASAGSALAKAKYVLHGGAPTENELAQLGGSTAAYDANALRQLIINWEKTPEYQTKVQSFLAVNLQQQALGNPRYVEQLGNIMRVDFKAIDDAALRQNLNTAFLRTSWDIVSKNQDFRKVINTREWQVTTAFLAALVYSDKPNQTAGKTYLQAPAPQDLFRALEHLQPSDYTDWRTVKLTQSNTPAGWSNTAGFVQSLRNIGEGGELALRYPRVGFFSSPVFLNYWVTNDDNQFRLTLNQTLIVALNKTFSPADATKHLTENGIPLEHADPQAVCYQCHRHMDPMRLVFDNTLATNYRAKDPLTANNRKPSFSLYGVSKNFANTDEFAQILSGHPEMPIGWVQKLCVWGNTARCDETDPEFIRLVNFFKNSNYSLRNLMRQFFSSPIFTGQTEQPSHQTNDFIVSLSRSNHFCDAIAARTQQINAAAGTTGSVNLCTNGSFGVVPEDEYSRGTVDLVQASRVSLFDAKSIDRECSRVATSAIASGTGSLFNLDSPVDDNLSYMAEYFMGIPKTHHRYNTVFKGLRRVYDIASKPNNCANPLNQGSNITCGYGLNKRDGLRAAWFSACTSPELIGVGM